MGREATCACRCGTETAQIKVLLEPPHLILRSPIPRHISLTQVQNLRADGPNLTFQANEENFSLTLGEPTAQRWAEAILKPAPTLAHKLGITPATHILLFGEPNSSELESALEQAASVNSRQANLTVLHAATLDELATLIRQAIPVNPIWILYPKGKSSTLGETTVRATMRELGFIDTKVASIDTKLTGLRFIRRTEPTK